MCRPRSTNVSRTGLRIGSVVGSVIAVTAGGFARFGLVLGEQPPGFGECAGRRDPATAGSRSFQREVGPCFDAAEQAGLAAGVVEPAVRTLPVVVGEGLSHGCHRPSAVGWPGG